MTNPLPSLIPPCTVAESWSKITQPVFQKDNINCKAFDWITTNCEKLLEMGLPDQFTCLLRNLYLSQEETVIIETDMEQLTGPKLGK